ncbi:MAG: metallophosphoesterase family protein [Candidatus Hodarchaeales archaeon]
MKKRVLVLADIHSNVVALEAVLDHINDHYSNIDHIITAGDYVGYGPYPNETLEICKTKFDVVSLGNHDLACAMGNADGFSKTGKPAALWTNEVLTDENKTYLSLLRESQKFHVIPSWEICVCHGSPDDCVSKYLKVDLPDGEKERLLKKAGTKMLICGHTHIPMHWKCKKGFIINPGSVGQPRDRDPRASCCILELTDNVNDHEYIPIRVDYNIRKVAKEILKQGLPYQLSERLIFGT